MRSCRRPVDCATSRRVAQSGTTLVARCQKSNVVRCSCACPPGCLLQKAHCQRPNTPLARDQGGPCCRDIRATQGGWSSRSPALARTFQEQAAAPRRDNTQIHTYHPAIPSLPWLCADHDNHVGHEVGWGKTGPLKRSHAAHQNHSRVAGPASELSTASKVQPCGFDRHASFQMLRVSPSSHLQGGGGRQVPPARFVSGLSEASRFETSMQ